MRRILLLTLLFPYLLIAQNSYNLSLLGTYEWNTTEGSDVWGWVDPINQNEYALFGLNDGFSCLNVSNPSNPIEEFYIPDINSTWRDIKTWGSYAYVTTDDDGIAPAGLLIVDLSDMSGNTYWHRTSFTNPINGNLVEFNAAHNLYIDENGICYIFGAKSSNLSNPSDGAIFLDVAANAINPVYLGEWDDEYIHDGMVRGDTMYAGCINTGNLFIVDVSNKSNPVVLGTHQTPNEFTHNAWVSDDGNYVFTTDEKPDSYIGSYDISDMSNIQEIDRIQSNPESNSIPHNTHVDGNFLVTSWYRDGTTVHDISNPHNLVQVAYYDSYPGSGDGFDGCWGTYPFLPSGIIISSEINSSNNQTAKLMIYERGFSEACYLQGNVTDGSSGATIVGANVVILNTTIANASTTNLSGDYTSGNADAGTFNVEFSMLGYITDTLQATLINGQVVILNTTLYVDPNVPILGCMDATANNFNPLATTSILFGGAIDNTIGAGDYFQSNQHQIINADKNCIIKSAKFYAENNNTITFELRDNNGSVLDDTTHNITAGEQVLELNFNVPSGNNMQLGIASDNSGLYRNSTGANYPYNIGNVLTITGNSANEPAYYYFYYDIEVEVACDVTINDTSNVIPTKNLIKLIDVLGRNTLATKNTPLFYIYDDGTVEKRIVIE